MATDNTNPGAEPGSATVTPSTDINDVSNLNFWEPEDEANPGEQASDAIDGDREPDEADEDGQESEEPADDVEEGEEQAEEEPDEAEEPAEDESEEPKPVDDDVTVTLKGGEQVKLGELKQGYMRDRDYRHKTSELGQKRRDLDELSSRIDQTVNAFADFLASQLPEEPSPHLAVSDPTKYTQQKAMYDAAMGQVQKIIEMGQQPKEVKGKLTEQQRRDSLAEENAKLAERFPQTTDPKTRQQFFESAFNVARELGYSDDEMKGVSDHRIFALAHYAKLGVEAEKAKGKARTKVEKAPPVTPQKKQHSKNAAAIKRNLEAKKRLNRTGSIHDAMLIDFE